ncbi:SRPBCC family protein [Catelliglobosispora koreensis]|uniref:SRPBCC family protein n=1 Tax=Catelliglobosispora koreensis TaxID=129052 RepID=UPI0003769D66|nr:SRPBCC family protein [Catelliglobosispora koreensis]
MASLTKEITIEASADEVWAVIGDFAGGPSRMAPGYVVDARVDGEHRVVTFANGTVAHERFVALDAGSRRIVYAIEGERIVHDNASMQVLEDGPERCRLIWIHDFLPDAIAPVIESGMTQALGVIKHTLESAAV